MFSEIWRWVEVPKYKVLKSLKGWGEGRCLNPIPPPPPLKKPSMEGKTTILLELTNSP